MSPLVPSAVPAQYQCQSLTMLLPRPLGPCSAALQHHQGDRRIKIAARAVCVSEAHLRFQLHRCTKPGRKLSPSTRHLDYLSRRRSLVLTSCEAGAPRIHSSFVPPHGSWHGTATLVSQVAVNGFITALSAHHRPNLAAAGTPATISPRSTRRLGPRGQEISSKCPLGRYPYKSCLGALR